MTPTDLITATETARRLNVAVGTLKRWRRGHTGPPWCRVGGRAVRYPVALLEAWLVCKNVETGVLAGHDSEGDHGADDGPGIILTTAADQGPQPPRWSFLANIRPLGG